MREGHLTRLPLAPGSFAERLPDTRLRRATRIGLLCLLALGPIGAVVLLLLDYGGISISEFVIYKAIVGIALGMLVTPLIAHGRVRRRPAARAGRSQCLARRSLRTMAARISDALRVGPGPVDLRRIDPGATPRFKGGKAAARKATEKLAPRLAELQERLFAEGRKGGTRSVLLVLQGLDTSGKGGTVRHVVGQMDPQGVRITSFGPPTPEERRHDFLWRIRRRLPEPGIVGVFDRSHYEDVVTVRVPEAGSARHVVPPVRRDQALRGTVLAATTRAS